MSLILDRKLLGNINTWKQWTFIILRTW